MTSDQLDIMLPAIRNGFISTTEAEVLLNDIYKAIKDDPDKGKELGKYVSLINNAIKLQQLETVICWVPIAGGCLAIGHKPGGKISFEGLKKEGASAIVTLLNENEGALQIGKQTEQADITWIWFPFSASKPEQYDTADVLQLYNQLKILLSLGGKIYIHCSAGIHRTGMITYGLLRYLKYDKDAALQMLNNLRPVTAQQVGNDRLLWSDQFGDAKNSAGNSKEDHS